MEEDHPKVLGVLAGEDIPLAHLSEWARTADVILAADGGGDRLLQVGITAKTTIGDMDSTQSVLPLRRIIKDTDQETSDCDKLLALAERTGYREITLIGAEGDRLDHVLGTLASAARSGLRVRIALRSGVAWILRGPVDFSLPLPFGELVSLMPLALCDGASLTGVEWPLDMVELSPFGQVSLSNRSSGGDVRVQMRSGAAALVVTSERLTVPIW